MIPNYFQMEWLFWIHTYHRGAGKCWASCTWMSSGRVLALGLGSPSAVEANSQATRLSCIKQWKKLLGCNDVTMSVPQGQAVQKKLWRPSTGCICGPRRFLWTSEPWNVRGISTGQPSGFGEIIMTLSLAIRIVFVLWIWMWTLLKISLFLVFSHWRIF